jgi:hypothetical protein
MNCNKRIKELKNHAVDLFKCSIVCREYGLDNTADEIEKASEAFKEFDSCVTNMQGLKRRLDSVLKAFEFNKKVCEAQGRELNRFQKENIRLKSKACHTCKHWDGDYCNKIGITIDIGGCGDYWEEKQ